MAECVLLRTLAFSELCVFVCIRANGVDETLGFSLCFVVDPS